MAKDYHVFIGSFTSEARKSNGDAMGDPAEGIEVLRFKSSDGAFEHLETIPGLISPSFIALHPTLPVLYAVERRYNGDDPSIGAITSFSIDDRSGHLEMTARVSTEANSPAHVSLHPSGLHAYAAHFKSGHVVAFPLDSQGRVQAPDQSIAHEGCGPHPRQASAHIHQVRPAPHGRFVHATDLGSDAILTYPADPHGHLSNTELDRVSLPPGTGPRHLAWHPSGHFAFTNGELSSTLCLLGYDPEEGHLEFLSATSTLPQSFLGRSSTSEVICHPNGRIVYVANRGHDSIAIFSFDSSTGILALLGNQSTLGQFPRNFNIDPSVSFLVVANQMSGSLVPFRIHPETNWPEPIGTSADSPSPSCVLFRPISP